MGYLDGSVKGGSIGQFSLVNQGFDIRKLFVTMLLKWQHLSLPQPQAFVAAKAHSQHLHRHTLQTGHSWCWVNSCDGPNA